MVAARVGDEAATVKALLESTELILRGAIKRRYAIDALRGAAVVGGELCFQVDGEAVALALGAVEGGRWLAKINTPPPTLAAKLGIGPLKPAWLWGAVDDAALAAALHGHTTIDPAAATVLVAIVRSTSDLAAAVEAHRSLRCDAVWVVHPKGRAASLGVSTVRQQLRALGYVDTKTAAVSQALTATRYVRR